MKRLFGILVLTLISFFFLFNSKFIAQDEGHYYTITTWKMTVPTDGSEKELNELIKEWRDKVVVKNDKVLSEKVLKHVSGSDMRDWVIVTEYATWDDIGAAQDLTNKLIDEGWSDKDARKKYFKTFWKYIITHSDEILQEKPKLTK